MEITKDIRYIGVDDHDIDLFEGQYDVSENGMAYNSYVILATKSPSPIRSTLALSTNGSATSRPCSMSVRPTTWSFITWSPITPPASLPLWSAIPRRRSWQAWAPSA